MESKTKFIPSPQDEGPQQLHVVRRTISQAYTEAYAEIAFVDQTHRQGWKEWKCTKTYAWMLAFQSDMRALVLTVSFLSRVTHGECKQAFPAPQRTLCQQALQKVREELSVHLKGYPDRAWDPGDDYDWLLHNVERVFPNDEGLELLNKWWTRLDKLEAQLKPVKTKQVKTRKSKTG